MAKPYPLPQNEKKMIITVHPLRWSQKEYEPVHEISNNVRGSSNK